MAKDEVKDGKKPSKALPGLIFLLGLALIVGGVLMQIGYFGGNDNPVPAEEETTVVDEGETVDEGTVDEGVVDDEGTADAGEADFSITTIEDNVPINVRSEDSYTYAGAFAMIVSEFSVNCEEDSCGLDGDQVVLKFSTADGKDYPVTLTPAEPTANLIDVPVTVQEWHQDYVVIMLTK